MLKAHPGAAATTMRLPPLDDAALTTEHRVALAKINAYYKAEPSGPYAVWAHQPGVAEASFQIFLAHRYEEKLERRLSELAIVIVGRDWSANFPWVPHKSAALKFGVGAEVLEAIQLGRRPAFIRDDEGATYDLIHELTWDRRIGQATYDRAVAVLGGERVVALVNVATFYAMVAICTVAFEMPVPDHMGSPEPLAPLKGLPKTAFGPAPSGPAPSGGRTRAPVLDLHALTPGQRVEIAKIEALLRRPPVGPFQIWAHQSGVACGAVQLYLVHRHENPDVRRLMEIMILTVARAWACQMEWGSHARQAAEQGVAAEIVEAIRLGRAPHFVNEDERVAYDLTHELSARRNLSQATFDRAVAVLGAPRVVALVNGVAFYTMVCMTIAAFEMNPPAGPEAALVLPPILADQGQDR